MATTLPPKEGAAAEVPPPLHAGQRLSQLEFHRRYEAAPQDSKFELIEGVVSMAAAQRRPHSRAEPLLASLLVHYEGATPGVEMLHNATTIMDEQNELQPDLQLRILTEYGGQAVVTPEQYILGPPEMVIEISHSSLHFDLQKKLGIYQRLGVKEYLVVDVEAASFHWFVWPDGERPLAADGVLRSGTFPGLWIDSQALFQERINDLQAVLSEGLKQLEHAEFAARLQNARGK